MRKCQLLERLYKSNVIEVRRGGELLRTMASLSYHFPAGTSETARRWCRNKGGTPGIREEPTKKGSFPIHPSGQPCSQSDPRSRMASNFIPHCLLILLDQIIVPCLNLELAPPQGPLKCEALSPAFIHQRENSVLPNSSHVC